MVYDAAREVAVLFGGALSCTNRQPLADTWEFDGEDWHQVATPSSPPPRYHAGLAYDSTRQVVVLFGGTNSLTPYNDTWEYDGTTWVQRFPPSPPPGCSFAGVLFGRVRNLGFGSPKRPLLEPRGRAEKLSHDNKVMALRSTRGLLVDFPPTRRRMTLFDRITFTPGVMGGRACIRGMRITVALVVNLVANGMTTEEILAEYPDLVAEDIEQALKYTPFPMRPS
jgi:uncharacterized protein (DUF433 family)